VTAAALFATAQFGAFDCSGLPVLSVATGAVLSGSATLGLVSLIRGRWAAGILAIVVAIIVFPVFLLSHMCG
jgi:hypothetical protein